MKKLLMSLFLAFLLFTVGATLPELEEEGKPVILGNLHVATNNIHKPVDQSHTFAVLFRTPIQPYGLASVSFYLDYASLDAIPRVWLMRFPEGSEAVSDAVAVAQFFNPNVKNGPHKYLFIPTAAVALAPTSTYAIFITTESGTIEVYGSTPAVDVSGTGQLVSFLESSDGGVSYQLCSPVANPTFQILAATLPELEEEGKPVILGNLHVATNNIHKPVDQSHIFAVLFHTPIQPYGLASVSFYLDYASLDAIPRVWLMRFPEGSEAVSDAVAVAQFFNPNVKNGPHKYLFIPTAAVALAPTSTYAIFITTESGTIEVYGSTPAVDVSGTGQLVSFLESSDGGVSYQLCSPVANPTFQILADLSIARREILTAQRITYASHCTYPAMAVAVLAIASVACLAIFKLAKKTKEGDCYVSCAFALP